MYPLNLILTTIESEKTLQHCNFIYNIAFLHKHSDIQYHSLILMFTYSQIPADYHIIILIFT